MVHTEETKKKLSLLRAGSANPFFGKKHSEATKLKMAEITRTKNLERQYDLNKARVIIPEEKILCYMAGFIDGEGCIRLKGKPGREIAFIGVYNTNVEVLALFKTYWGRKVIHMKNNLARTPCYSITLQAAQDVYKMIMALMPYLIVKKEDALKAIDFLKTKYGKRLWE